MIRKASDRASALIAQYAGGKVNQLYDIGKCIPDEIVLDLDIKKTQFRKFKAQNITGNLIVRNKSVTVQNGYFESMKGHTNFNGTINGTNPERLVLTCDADIQKVDISKLFYEFGNFGQNNITSRKLKGRVTAKVFYESSFSNTLKIDPGSVNTVGDITIENGELINYTPLYKLGRFLKNKNVFLFFISDCDSGNDRRICFLSYFCRSEISGSR